MNKHLEILNTDERKKFENFCQTLRNNKHHCQNDYAHRLDSFTFHSELKTVENASSSLNQHREDNNKREEC